MKKQLIAMALFLSATTVFADANLTPKEDLQAKVLAQLIAQSGSIELVEYDYENPTEYRKYPYSLPEILAGALQQNYLSGNSVLSYTTVDCEPVENTIVPGTAFYGCNVIIGSGDFEQTEGQLNGPLYESSLYFSIDVEVPVVPNAKPRITTTQAVVAIAG